MKGEPFGEPSGVSRELGKVILKACAYKPSDRYASPGEFRRELERAGNGGKPEAKKSSGASRFVKWIIAGICVLLAGAALLLKDIIFPPAPASEPVVVTPSPTAFSVPETETPEVTATQLETEYVPVIILPTDPVPPTETLAPAPTPTLAPTTTLTPTQTSDLEVKKGDVVLFGTYEQDGDPENGQEPIEWIVLKAENGKAMLISRYILDGHAFCSKEKDDVTWEESALREWLNTEFLNTAFTETDQRSIGRIGTDAVSLPAAEKYTGAWTIREFDEDTPIMFGYPTRYAEKKVSVNEQTNAAWWWTRTKEEGTYNRIMCVNAWHDIKPFTEERETGGVRPLISVWTDTLRPSAGTLTDD